MKMKLKKFVAAFLSAVLLVCGLFSSVSCSEKKSGPGYTIEQDKYLFGMGEVPSDVVGGATDSKVTMETVATLAGELGVKSFRLWMHITSVCERAEDSNEVRLKTDAVQKFHQFIDLLKDNGVTHFTAMNHYYLYPVGYSASAGCVVPDPNLEFEEYVEFMELLRECYRLLAAEFWNTLEEQTVYASAGLIQPIGDLIDLYAPNYKKMMDENPEIEKRTMLGDGKIYSFASINTVPRDLTFKQFINQKWLDALGLDMPETIEEFYDVLVAFKTQDPNGNGFADEIPLSSVGLNQTRNFLMSAFGYVSTGIEVGDDGKVVFVPATENYWNYIQFANKLYTEGLLDKDVFSMNADKELAQKGSQNILGCFDGGAAYLIVGNNLDPD